MFLWENKTNPSQGVFCCKNDGKIARKCAINNSISLSDNACEFKFGNSKSHGTIQYCDLILPQIEEIFPEMSVENQISHFRNQLIHLSQHPLIVEAIEDMTRFIVPKFNKIEALSSELYEGALSKIGSGQDALVYKTTSKIDRPEVGIIKGQPLVVRGARFTERYEVSSTLSTLRNFSRLSYLRNPQQPITEFYPAFYGSYQAEGDSHPYHPPSRQVLNFQEMEYVDVTYEKEYSERDRTTYQMRKVPDSVVFEFCLGEWAGGFFSKVGSSDKKAENYGIKKNISYSRTYKIQDKEYIISSEIMPKRLDVGGAGSISDYVYGKMKKSYVCSIPVTYFSPAAIQFLSNLASDKNKSVFDAFDTFFNSSDELREGAKIKEDNHLFIWPELK